MSRYKIAFTILCAASMEARKFASMLMKYVRSYRFTLKS